MIKNDPIITNMLYGDVVRKIAEEKGIGLSEARLELAQMSFKQYNSLIEATVTPPSGNTIGPGVQKPSSVQKQPQATGPSAIKSLWPGQGSPMEVGMTVGMKDKTGKPAPGTVSQIDKSANGVKIKNPATGQEEWMNIDTVEPFATSDVNNQSGQDLQRLKELAGIGESCSAGATGAGAIAVSPVSSGSVKRRQATAEAPKKEYTPKSAPKTIVGDTKPSQASGELSSTLAANGKKTASRKNNGFKK